MKKYLSFHFYSQTLSLSLHVLDCNLKKKILLYLLHSNLTTYNFDKKYIITCVFGFTLQHPKFHSVGDQGDSIQEKYVWMFISKINFSFRINFKYKPLTVAFDFTSFSWNISNANFQFCIPMYRWKCHTKIEKVPTIHIHFSNYIYLKVIQSVLSKKYQFW